MIILYDPSSLFLKAKKQKPAQHFHGCDWSQSRNRKCAFPFLLLAMAIIYKSTEYGKGSDKFTVVFGWLKMTNDGWGRQRIPLLKHQIFP